MNATGAGAHLAIDTPNRPRPASAISAPAGDTLDGATWRREMERAQLQSWFAPARSPTRAADAGTVRSDDRPRAPQGGAPSTASGRGGCTPIRRPTPPTVDSTKTWEATRPLVAASPGASVLTAAARTPVVAVAGAHSTTPSLPTTAVLDMKPDAQVPRLGQRVAWMPGAADTERKAVGEPDGPTVTIEPRTGGRLRPSATEHAMPLRLHQESTPRGQAVWIGLPVGGNELDANLPRIVANLLEGMRAAGQRLHQVVCNGRLLWRDGSYVPSDAGSGRPSNLHLY